jgi:hypothetical protein
MKTVGKDGEGSGTKIAELVPPTRPTTSRICGDRDTADPSPVNTSRDQRQKVERDGMGMKTG